jgi:hypothetical protein
MNIKHEIRPGQSIELLKELHILTRDGKLNQDSRRKLKQVYHLYRFIEPLLLELKQNFPAIQLVDLGAGKSYLGFILPENPTWASSCSTCFSRNWRAARIFLASKAVKSW